MIIPLFSIGQQGKSSTVTAQSHTNVYAEISVDADKSNIAFYGTPGLVLFADFGDTPHRGAIAVGDFIYTVHRGTFWELNNAGVRVNRGSLSTTSGRVQMAFNGQQIAMVDGTNMYVYMTNRTAQTISGIVNTGTLATVTTASPHLRYTGETVTVTGATPSAFNGTFVITVTSPTTFTYTMLSNPGVAVPISTITRVTTTATLTTTAPHNRSTGDTITVSGATPAAYNGTFVITVTGASTFTYTMLSDPGGNATVVGSYVVVSSKATVVGSYSVVSSFVTVSSGLFENPADITFQDGYGIASFANSGQFQISSSYDFTTWDALDFATAESNPDNVIRVIADHGELVLSGSETTEFWGNSGALDFPYSNIRGSTIEFGCAAKYSLTKYDDSLIGLFKNRMGQVNVMQLVGHAVRKVSTNELDYIINNYDSLADATGYTYMLGGHPMYQINFPTEGKSWLYDGSTGLWTILESGLNGMRHRGEFLVDYLNKPRVFDYSNGRIYTMDADAYTDNGTPIKRQLRAKHFFKDFKRVTVQRLNLDFETGVGLNSGQGEDPQVMLRVSRDNGHTWGAELWRSIGRIGKYLTRVFWTRLGSSRDFVFEITVSDPVKFALPAASIEAEVTQ